MLRLHAGYSACLLKSRTGGTSLSRALVTHSASVSEYFHMSSCRSACPGLAAPGRPTPSSSPCPHFCNQHVPKDEDPSSSERNVPVPSTGKRADHSDTATSCSSCSLRKPGLDFRAQHRTDLVETEELTPAGQAACTGRQTPVLTSAPLGCLNITQTQGMWSKAFR